VNELLARIRRTLALRGAAQTPQTISFDDGHVQIDEAQRRLSVGGEVVSLTRKEWAVLLHLVQANGGLVAQGTLLQQIWGASHVSDTQYLRNVMQKLRQKFGDDAAHPHYLETEPGVGYRFIPNQPQQQAQ
jgi:two-component system, OmpR family, KDP operon response regulator KdpE